MSLWLPKQKHLLSQVLLFWNIETLNMLSKTGYHEVTHLQKIVEFKYMLI